LTNFDKNGRSYGQHLSHPTVFFSVVGFDFFFNIFGQLATLSDGNLTPVTLVTGVGVGRGTAERGRAAPAGG